MQDAESSGGSASASGGPKKVKTGPLNSAVDQLMNTMGKSERQMSPAHKKLLAQQKLTIERALEGFKEDGDRFLKDILDLAAAHKAGE